VGKARHRRKEKRRIDQQDCESVSLAAVFARSFQLSSTLRDTFPIPLSPSSAFLISHFD